MSLFEGVLCSLLFESDVGRFESGKVRAFFERCTLGKGLESLLPFGSIDYWFRGVESVGQCLV